MTARFRGRKRLRFGPLFFNFSQSGFTSWGIKFGRFTWNISRGTKSVDTPGFGSVQWGSKRRRRRGGERR